MSPEIAPPAAVTSRSVAASIAALPVPDIHTETLPNGAQIITNARPGATTANIQVGFRAGGFQDPAGKQGLAHLVEHLAFEGTPTRSHEEIFREGRREGISNAGTALQQTVYYSNVPTRDARSAVDRITDQVTHINTAPYRVAKEKRVVQQEMRFNKGEKSWQAAQEAEILKYGADVPQNRINIGTNESVGSITPGDVRNFVQKNYVGANVVAYVDGDPSAFNLDLLRDRLGALPAGEAAHDPKPQSAAPVSGARVEVIPHSGTNEAVVHVMIPFAKDATTPVQRRMLTSILSEAVSERVRERNRLSYSAGARLDSDHVDLWAKLEPQHVSAGIEQLVRAAKELPGKVTANNVSDARRGLINGTLMAAEQPSGTADAQFEAAVSGVASVAKEQPTARQQIAKVQRTTTASVQDAARGALDLGSTKILMSGAVNGQSARDAVQGAQAGGIAAEFTRVPFKRSRYDAMFNTPQGPLQ